MVECSEAERDVLWTQTALQFDMLKAVLYGHEAHGPAPHMVRAELVAFPELTAAIVEVLDQIGWARRDTRDSFELAVAPAVLELLRAIRHELTGELRETTDRARPAHFTKHTRRIVDHDLDALGVVNAILERADQLSPPPPAAA